MVIVNEADRVSAQAETIWLDRLEHLPAKTVIVFTTNYPEKLSPRFRDRCLRLEFTGDAEELRPWAQHLVCTVWRAETGKTPSSAHAARIVETAVESAIDGGQLSMRRVIQKVEMALLYE